MAYSGTTRGYKRISVIGIDNLMVDLRAAKKNRALRLALNKTLAEYCDPFVPYLYGELSDVKVSPQGVTYPEIYARYQYTGISYTTGEPLNYTKTYHPLATAKWDEVMLSTVGDAFRNDCANLIAKHLERNRKRRKNK